MARKSIIWKIEALNVSNCDQNIPGQAVSWKPVIQSAQLETSSCVDNITII